MVRLAATRALLAVERGRATLAGEIERARAGQVAERDRALLLELVAGTLRWRGELDAILAAHSARALSSLDARVLTSLRLGAYQLRHLDRVPAHAVVHEAVEVIRALGQPRAAGFVNAVLRSIARGNPDASLPPRPAPEATAEAQLPYLTVTLSHPEWLVRRWLGRVGFDAAEAWCQFNNATPDVTVRSRGRLGQADLLTAIQSSGIDAQPGRIVRSAVRLPAGSLGRLPAPLRDELVVQDEGSQLVAHAAGAQPGERVLDVCAAPGGKTGILAQAIAGRGQIVASDHRASRVDLLRRTVERDGLRASVLALDLTRPLPFGAVFDRVIVDVPCSGLGTLRRDPDLKWSRRPEDLAKLAETERQMLANAAEAVRPGGTLFYATCSSEPEENDEVVDAFLASDARFSLGDPAPGPDIEPGPWLDRRGLLRTLPSRDRLDAYFAAVLVRRQDA